ncbi:hypothetical protein PFY00_03720 [Thalassococcus lentus]|uniref:Uncharacterized protein n=1 Tax=Thalassococcus lentus TaxID=1210524 RepID=A0ABT4XPN9_9RHOB|nr:hypothetical protein [Thalassococcus lentus]MDA7423823.1 hypothetical protein [Thalassococcus lentus]
MTGAALSGRTATAREKNSIAAGKSPFLTAHRPAPINAPKFSGRFSSNAEKASNEAEYFASASRAKALDNCALTSIFELSPGRKTATTMPAAEHES